MLKYRIDGQGDKVVVFLHGWGGNIDSFVSIASKLQSSCTCIRVEWDTKESVGMGKPHSIFCYASELYCLLEALNYKNVYLVGHSFGGRVGILLSSLFDIKVEGLVLIDSAGLRYHKSLKKWYALKKYAFLKKLVKRGLLKQEVLTKYGSSDYKVLTPFEKVGFNKVVSCYLDEYLGRITCPTLAIWGDKDKDTPLYFAKRLKRKIADCDMVVYLGCGHFSYLQKEGQTYLILKSFFGV